MPEGFGTIGRKRTRRYELIMHPQIPKPLHGVAPRKMMGRAWWDDVRHRCYRTSGRQCACCGVYFSQVEGYARPEAHEVYDIDYAKGRATFKEVVALCHWCHMSIHIGLVESLFHQGEMDFETYHKIQDHREHHVKLALEEGYTYPDRTPGERVPWSDWRMVIDGQEFEPIFATYGDWLAHYGDSVEDTWILEEFFTD